MPDATLELQHPELLLLRQDTRRVPFILVVSSSFSDLSVEINRAAALYGGRPPRSRFGGHLLPSHLHVEGEFGLHARDQVSAGFADESLSRNCRASNGRPFLRRDPRNSRKTIIGLASLRALRRGRSMPDIPKPAVVPINRPGVALEPGHESSYAAYQERRSGLTELRIPMDSAYS